MSYYSFYRPTEGRRLSRPRPVDLSVCVYVCVSVTFCQSVCPSFYLYVCMCLCVYADDSLQPYLDMIDQLDESVTALEQAAYKLDNYSRRLGKFYACDIFGGLGNDLRHVVHSHCASVHQAVQIGTGFTAGKVTAVICGGLALLPYIRQGRVRLCRWQVILCDPIWQARYLWHTAGLGLSLIHI